MLSNCFAISDRWGMGPLNVGWLVDPPDVLNSDDLIRDWTIRFSGIPEDAVVEIVATDLQSGAERVASVVAGHRDALVHVMTAPNEVIELRTPRPFEAPMPVVEQRWLEPITAIPVAVESPVIDHVDGLLGVREPAGRTVIIDVATESALANSASAPDRLGGRLGRLHGALERQIGRAENIDATSVTEMSPDTVAVARGTEVVIAKVHGYGRL
jgi:hypothetical protein